MKNVEKATESHDQHFLNILVGYGMGGRSLFSRIKKKLFRDIFEVDPPDLMVSTAGRDFSVLLDSIPENTETLVVDTFFPDLTKEDVEYFIRYYNEQRG
jgi:undecaprenyl pyrophosphate synthase